jgi:hypothetical protein
MSANFRAIGDILLGFDICGDITRSIAVSGGVAIQ